MREGRTEEEEELKEEYKNEPGILKSLEPCSDNNCQASALTEILIVELQRSIEHRVGREYRTR